MKNLQTSNALVPPIIGTIMVFYMVGLYTIFLRGLPFLGSQFNLKGPAADETLSDIIAKEADAFGKMAHTAILDSRAYSITTNLEASSFWTSKGVNWPMLHAGGLVATIPSAYFLLSESWYGIKRSKAVIFFFLPLNVFPVLFCKGTPSIRALGVMLLLGGLVQLGSSRQKGNRAQMRI